MADAIFRFQFDEGEYDLTRITRSELSHFKQWYGQDYGERLTLIMKAIREDADAVACIIWACRREHGLQPNPDPRNMPDFDPATVFAKVTEDDLEAQENQDIPLEQTDNPS